MDLPLSHTTSGYLLKKGGGRSRVGEGALRSQLHRRNWLRRWFVLDVESGELQYYKDASMQQYKGTIRILPASSIQVPDTVCLRGRHRPARQEALHYFELHRVTDEDGRVRKHPFAARAPSGEELIEWLRALQACLKLQRDESDLYPSNAGITKYGQPASLSRRRQSQPTPSIHSNSSTPVQAPDKAMRRMTDAGIKPPHTPTTDLEPIVQSDWSSSDSDAEDDTIQDRVIDIPPAPPMAPLSAGGHHMKELERIILRRKHIAPEDDQDQNSDNEYNEHTNNQTKDRDTLLPPKATTLSAQATQVLETTDIEHNVLSPINRKHQTATRLPLPVPIPARDEVAQHKLKTKPPPPPPPPKKDKGNGISTSILTASSPTQRRRQPPPEPKTQPPQPPHPIPLQNLVSPLSKRDIALHDLAVVCAGTDIDAIAVAIAHAVHEANIPPKHAAIIRAQEKLDFLEQPTDKRQANYEKIQKALKTAANSDALGAAIRAAVAYGINPDSDPLVLEAQARLLEYIVNDKQKEQSDPTSPITSPRRRTRRSSTGQIPDAPATSPSVLNSNVSLDLSSFSRLESL